MRLVREIEIPEISATQKAAFAILCAKEVYKEEKWNEWTNKWLSREDRRGTYDRVLIDYNADDSYYYSANAAYSAGNTIIYFNSFSTCRSLDAASGVSRSAANAATSACSAAFVINSNIDLIKIAEEAMKVQ